MVYPSESRMQSEPKVFAAWRFGFGWPRSNLPFSNLSTNCKHCMANDGELIASFFEEIQFLPRLNTSRLILVLSWSNLGSDVVFRHHAYLFATATSSRDQGCHPHHWYARPRNASDVGLDLAGLEVDSWDKPPARSLVFGRSFPLVEADELPFLVSCDPMANLYQPVTCSGHLAIGDPHEHPSGR